MAFLAPPTVFFAPSGTPLVGPASERPPATEPEGFVFAGIELLRLTTGLRAVDGSALDADEAWYVWPESLDPYPVAAFSRPGYR